MQEKRKQILPLYCLVLLYLSNNYHGNKQKQGTTLMVSKANLKVFNVLKKKTSSNCPIPITRQGKGTDIYIQLQQHESPGMMVYVEYFHFWGLQQILKTKKQ